MEFLDLARTNLTSPVVLAFVLGVIASLIRSDLRIPEQIYALLSIYLLLAIGLKGGAALSESEFAELWRPLIAALSLSCGLAALVVAVTHLIGRLDVPNAAALGAHYGSVSVVTFTAATSFLTAAQVAYEGFMPTLLAVMEIPGIIVALVIASSRRSDTNLAGALREVVTGRSIVLLVGGLTIGLISGKKGLASVDPVFVGLFSGVLLLFLLEMGITAAGRIRDLRTGGAFLIGFGLVAPVVHGMIGVLAGTWSGLSLGGTTLLGVLAASASYIAAPAAVRLALPEANPAIYLTAALGVTFPFNLTIGIPLYHQFAKAVT